MNRSRNNYITSKYPQVQWSEVTQHDVFLILQHVLSRIQKGVWHALDDEAGQHPTISYATGITKLELESLLLATKVLNMKGQQRCFSLDILQNVSNVMRQDNIPIVIKQTNMRLNNSRKRIVLFVKANLC